ncbi:MAG: FKBP-type peptidyl-prolyl cis-trans isomerase [Porticoccaceae bacterium]|jgi:FKBP-type peptidyl-prolyl cis-trans isomerase SlpA
MSITIDTGVQVTLHFSLALENGEIVDSNYDKKPATFTLGDGNLLPGFEQKLVGLRAGDQREFTLPPASAFGQRNPENIQQVDRSHFDQQELEPGAVFSFQNGDGELPGVITEVGTEQVTVDFNHPLSGHSIIFRVDIINLAPATLH